MNLTCIIVDDEPPAIRLLEKYVERIPFLEKLAVFSDSLKALEFLNSNSVDVIFLDIQMPQLTGLQLSKILPEGIKVIFTTAYPDFALEGFDLNATDYLLKPIAFERFYKAVSKLSSEAKTTSAPAAPATDYIFIKTDGKNKFAKIFLNDILYVEALQNYVSIHTANGTIITHNSLKNILDLLPATDFIQIHRSFAVAIKQIDTTDSFSVFVKEKELPLGNTYKDAFFKRIGEV
ncbi:LytTR family DNA-binding domain-containing protein [Flavobacterium sp. DGU11]|uniref:LytTR family DNA-binding domain-containing protein n=1 Tax=Flavobacterium arundinis TaxID=3139143 RepID=A0ABU9HZC9_9FLAO